MEHPQRFSREQRIRKKAEYDAAFSTGRRRNRGWMGLVVAKNNFKLPRLGMTVPKAVGNAVARNRSRRWIREAFRRNQELFKSSVDLVVLTRKGIAESSYAEVESILLHLAREMGATKR